MNKSIVIALVAFLFSNFASGEQKAQWYPDRSSYRPGVRWWWLGSAVDSTGLQFNLSQFALKGIGAVEITPIYGVKDNEANDIPYLSPRWLDHYKYVRQLGDSLDILIDLSNTTGWPFGGPNVTPDMAAAKYIIETWTVKQGVSISEKILPRDKKQQSVAKLNRLIAYRGTVRKDVTRFVDRDGVLHWTPDADCQLYALFSGRTFQQVKRAAPGGEGLVLNHYDRNHVNRYLQRFDLAFRESRAPYPNTFFNDSFEVYGASWDDDFLSAFERRNAYKLQDYLPEFLYETADKDLSARIVNDYRETLADLLLDNFTLSWKQWANQRGSKVRNQAHGSPANILDIYAAVDIPECESFGRTPFSIRGLSPDSITKMSDAEPAVLKFASSAANLTGKKLTSAESLTWLTEHFRTSLAECKPEIDQMICAGVNNIYLHGAPYSPKGIDFPGWMFYASVNLSPTNSIWHHADALFGYIARIQAFMQESRSDNDFLLYIPLHDIWYKQQSRPFLIFDIHKMDRTMPELKQTVRSIVQNGYDVDYISDKFIEELSVNVNGELVTRAGTAYKSLILPQVKQMPIATLQKIGQLIRLGARVAFIGGYPQDVPGMANLKHRRSLFTKLLRCFPTIESIASPSALKYGKGTIVTAAHCQSILPLCGAQSEELRTKYKASVIRKINERGSKRYFLSMLNADSIRAWVSLLGNYDAVVAFDPMSRQIARLPIRKLDDDHTQVYLSVSSGQSLILETYVGLVPDIEIQRYYQPATSVRAIKLNNSFSLSFLKSDPPIDQIYSLPKLEFWNRIGDPLLTRNVGVARYTTSFDLPVEAVADEWRLSLTQVCHSVKISINDSTPILLWAPPFETFVGQYLKPGRNTIAFEVVNLPVNRILDLESRKVPWRRFKDANVLGVATGKTIDLSTWKPIDSGLSGEIILQPLQKESF